MAPVTDDSSQKPIKRGRSAQPKGRNKSSPSNSPPDPLENWSTAGIASMNAILSMDNDSDEY